jgi:hypothetical protein
MAATKSVVAAIYSGCPSVRLRYDRRGCGGVHYHVGLGDDSRHGRHSIGKTSARRNALVRNTILAQ